MNKRGNFIDLVYLLFGDNKERSVSLFVFEGVEKIQWLLTNHAMINIDLEIPSLKFIDIDVFFEFVMKNLKATS